MIAPQFATHRIGSPSASHTIELFLGQSSLSESGSTLTHIISRNTSLSVCATDLVCPFSKKQLTGVRKTLIPLIENNEEVRKNLSIIIAQGESDSVPLLLIKATPILSL